MQAEKYEKIDYLTYSDLENSFTYDELKNLIVIFEEKLLNNSIENFWKVEIDILNSFRKINKYYPVEISLFLNKFTGFIIESIINLRSSVSKNSLLFLQEVFEFANQRIIPLDFFKKIIKVIYEKYANSDKIFIKIEVKKSIDNFEKNFSKSEILESLSELLKEKNFKIQEIAANSLKNIVKNCFKIVIEDEENFKNLLIKIWSELDGKRMVVIKCIEDIFYECSVNLGEKDFNNICKDIFNEEKFKVVLNVLERKKNGSKNLKSKSIKNFIKIQKLEKIEK